MRCEEKIQYKGRKLAKTVAGRASKEAGYTIRAYKCPVCGYWHLTHVEQRSAA